MTVTSSLTALEVRVARLDAKVDEQFAVVGARFDRVDARFEQTDARFESRLNEQRAQMMTLFEASRVDFNNLYDFVRAQAERTDARLDQLQADLITRTTDLHAAIAALAPRLRRARLRR